MEVDRIFYIFGSFSRKKSDKRKSLDQSSLSAGNSPIHGAKAQRPHSQNIIIPARTSAYQDGSKKLSKEFECGICKKNLVEPRLLWCLHSFCTRCLQGLHQEGEAEVWSEIDRGLQDPGGSRSTSGAGSAGSGYESDLPSGSDVSIEQKQPKYGIFTRRISGKSVQYLLCPKCGQETLLPLGGISALPLNYILLRKILAADRDIDCVSVLCDLCSTDNRAESRCGQCLVSVCTSCADVHMKQKKSRHSLMPLDPAPVKFCSQHPRSQLNVYCATCQQVICRDCCIISHSGHALANSSLAARERTRLLRDACGRATLVPAQVDDAARALGTGAEEADAQAARVEAEIKVWAEEYRRAVEAHGRALCTAAARVRARYRQRVEERTRELDHLAEQAREAVKFTEELLADARDDEVLSLSGTVLRRLEALSTLPPAPPAPALRLARTAPAPAPTPHGPPLVGRLVAHTADPDQCVLNTDGLQDLEVDELYEATLELRDSNGERIWCGGEQVAGYFRRRDSSARPALARVSDKCDGSYSIAFAVPTPGAYLLAVTLNNVPIKGSPFPCAARVRKPHTGQFHCCAFCSSGGKKSASCGCGATMSGGYKGCGHGHAGHPGARHWSCCGSTQQRGPCRGSTQQHRATCAAHQSHHTHKLYQFSL